MGIPLRQAARDRIVGDCDAERSPDLPRVRGCRSPAAPGVRSLCSSGRVAGAAVAKGCVAAPSRGDMGCAGRVHRLDLSADAAREFIPNARRPDHLQRKFHPALHTTGFVSCGSHARNAGGAGESVADSESRGVRCGDFEKETRVTRRLEDVTPQVFVVGDRLEAGLHHGAVDANGLRPAVRQSEQHFLE